MIVNKGGVLNKVKLKLKLKLNTFKYRAKLVQAFSFQPVRHESGIFRYECIKICLHHDLESARLVI